MLRLRYTPGEREEKYPQLKPGKFRWVRHHEQTAYYLCALLVLTRPASIIIFFLHRNFSVKFGAISPQKHTEIARKSLAVLFYFCFRNFLFEGVPRQTAPNGSNLNVGPSRQSIYRFQDKPTE